jgi:CheY-like chemotaxis protein
MVEYSVLIIDDDIWMQRILSKTLQSYGFKKSYLASNGFEGIAMAVEFIPSLIVMDILMPDLSGHLALRILKSIKCTKDVPVIMVSALSDTENLGKAFKSGTAAFISKPFTRATIFEKLVSIFGNERLELISKGEDMEMYQQDFFLEDSIPDFANENYFAANTQPQTESTEKPNTSKVSIPTDKLKQQYFEEEKRSIESIKKMLLRNKK